MFAAPVENSVVFSGILSKQPGSRNWMSMFREPKWCKVKERYLTIEPVW